MPNTIDEAIKILQAMKEGKTIQFQSSGGKWLDRGAIDEGFPNFNRDTYRIKPEPREIWANEYLGGQLGFWSSKEEAVRAVGYAPRKVIKFREVLDE